jgi:hypothetical protein
LTKPNTLSCGSATACDGCYERPNVNPLLGAKSCDGDPGFAQYCVDQDISLLPIFARVGFIIQFHDQYRVAGRKLYDHEIYRFCHHAIPCPKITGAISGVDAEHVSQPDLWTDVVTWRNLGCKHL